MVNADQREAWKRALAAYHRQQRQQRARRRSKLDATGPGMIRVQVRGQPPISGTLTCNDTNQKQVP